MNLARLIRLGTSVLVVHAVTACATGAKPAAPSTVSRSAATTTASSSSGASAAASQELRIRASARRDGLLFGLDRASFHAAIWIPGATIEQSADGSRWRVDGHEVGVMTTALEELGLPETAGDLAFLQAQRDRQRAGAGASASHALDASVTAPDGSLVLLATLLPVAADRADEGVSCVAMASRRVGRVIVSVAFTAGDCEPSHLAAPIEVLRQMTVSSEPVDLDTLVVPRDVVPTS